MEAGSCPFFAGQNGIPFTWNGTHQKKHNRKKGIGLSFKQNCN